jgi:GntP family gluconate:H+ symporter
MALVARWGWSGSAWIAAVPGFIAGFGSSPAAAFAVLTPLVRPLGGRGASGQQRVSTALALAISASHGLVLFSPVVIATVAILDVSWSQAALFGLPVAVLAAAAGALWARRRLNVTTLPVAPAASVNGATGGGGLAVGLALATAIPLLLLIVQSLGDIPSEPFGGATRREMILGLGRSLILLLVGVGIMVAARLRPSLKLLAGSAWTTRILGNAAGVLLTVGAAGGLQRLCQETGMAELLGERLTGWHFGGAGMVLVPFLTAATIKTLQGSSLVAAITTAGMVQPLLLPAGAGDETGRALAALAIGAGSMTVSHINDEYFWLVSLSAGLRPLRALLAISVGTLLQGFVAVAALVILALALAHA